MKRKWTLAISFCLFFAAYAHCEEADVIAKQDANRRETIRYGTDAELIALIETLEKENNSSLDGDLTAVLKESSGIKFIDTIFSYLTRGKKKGGEDRALRILENRDKEGNSNVDSAIQYLAVMKEKKAAGYFRTILEAEDSRFGNAAARALGVCGSEDDAVFLVKYQKERDVPDSLIGDIIYALGELKSKNATEFLTAVLSNPDSKPYKKILVIEALGKIKDNASIDPIIASLRETDANVRAYAAAALSSFTDDKTEKNVIECFRDSFYKVRISAAKSAAARKMGKAIPFLKYRAEHDDVVAVKEESIIALGVIGGKQAEETLSTIFANKNAVDRLRIAAAKALLELAPDQNAATVVAALELAKTEKKMTLYHGLAKTITAVKSSKFEELAGRFLSSNDVSDKVYGLDLVILNRYGSLKELIRPLEKDPNAAVIRKARQALGD